MGFARNLGDLVPRLELLGFKLNHVEQEYRRAVENCLDEKKFLYKYSDDHSYGYMSFTEFREFVLTYPINELDDTFIRSIEMESGQPIKSFIFDEVDVKRIPNYKGNHVSTNSERSYFGDLLTNVLHPYSVLRLLAENKENRKAEVVWQYGPLVVFGGYASKDQFIPNARRTQTFLIATEGSSDISILHHAFSLLRPGISDFFRFIDMNEGYPFTGAGNLVKFATGLVKIDIQNFVVFLFDNDAEGLEAYTRIENLSLPPNMRPVLLPELDALRSVTARGPDGVKVADINRRAAAIEFYLDFESPELPTAEVIWTNYKKKIDAYHGALQNKEAYMKAFMKQTSESLTMGEYDVSKISVVLDALFLTCCSIASDVSSLAD